MIGWVKLFHDAYTKQTDDDYEVNIWCKDGTITSVLALALNTVTEH